MGQRRTASAASRAVTIGARSSSTSVLAASTTAATAALLCAVVVGLLSVSVTIGVGVAAQALPSPLGGDIHTYRNYVSDLRYDTPLSPADAPKPVDNVNTCDDCLSGYFALPFVFNFYGRPMQSINVAANGWYPLPHTHTTILAGRFANPSLLPSPILLTRAQGASVRRESGHDGREHIRS